MVAIGFSWSWLARSRSVRAIACPGRLVGIVKLLPRRVVLSQCPAEGYTVADDVASKETGDVTAAVVTAAQDRPERQESVSLPS